MEKIKYGIIGFGGIAENRIAKEGFACDKTRFSELPNAELYAVTELNAQRKQTVLDMGLKWVNSTEEMLNMPEIKAVFIATNNRSHAAIAKQALNAGKHVIIEKPIATTVEDANELVALAEAKNLSLTVDHMMVNNPYSIKAKELLNSGKLGTVNDSCFHMEFAYGYAPEEANSWRCSDIKEMGGPIGDVASHCMYVAEFIFGEEIEKIAAVYYPKLMDIKAEDGAYIKFFLKSGLSGSIRVAFSEYRGGLVGTLSNLGYELYGDKAVLRSYGAMFQLSGHENEPIPIRLELDCGATKEDIKADKIQNIYQQLIIEHAQSIIDGKRLSGKNAAHNLVLCNAIHNSASENGKLISLKG